MDSSYDPRAWGAKCSRCPLSGQTPVPPEPARRGEPFAILVGEIPGSEEEKQGRPFVGSSGFELNRALQAAGIRRDRCHITNAVLCKPEGPASGALERVEKQVSKRRKAGDEMVLSPVDACRPRLLTEIGSLSCRDVIPLGAVALRALTGERSKILDVRGGPREIGISLNDPEALSLRVLPTVHPAFVMRTRRWTGAFVADLGRAKRWFTSGLEWRDPVTLYRPSPAQLRGWLERVAGQPFIVYDVETAPAFPEIGRYDASFDRLRCVGLCTADRRWATVVPFRSKEDVSRTFYSLGEYRELIAILRDFFSSNRWRKVGHNCVHSGTRVVMENGDTIPIEKIVRSKMPGRVKALLPDGSIGSAEIKGWIRKTVQNQQWIVVRSNHEKEHTRGLTLTPEHRVLTHRGWIWASDLTTDDSIHFDEPLLSDDQLCAVLGTALGDSTISKSPSVKAPKSQSPSLIIRGSHTDPAMTAAKVAALRSHVSALPPEKNEGGFKPHISYPFASKNLRQLVSIAPLLFDEDDSRRLRVETLERLGAIGFAWWFMDDGCKHKRSGSRAGGKEPIQIAACRYPLEDVKIAAAWLTDRFGSVVLDSRAEDHNRRILRFGVEATENFCRMIACHVFPSQRYKLPNGYGDWPEFKATDPDPTPRPTSLKVESVSEWIPPETDRERDTIWCITTTTGNFFTTLGLIENSGYYDRMVIESHFGVTPTPHLDTIGLHKFVEPELPHSLGYVGSIHTDVNAWKQGRPAESAETDQDLWTYNAKDCAVTASVVGPLAQAIKERKQEKAAAFWPFVQSLCVDLHKNGMHVDQAKRRDWDDKMLRLAKEHLGIIRDASGRRNFNPGSFQQVADLIFDEWQLLPVNYTDAGEPSTDDESLREIMAKQSLTDPQRISIENIRLYRRRCKYRGTYTQKLRPMSEMAIAPELAIDEEADDEDEVLWRLNRGRPKAGVILADGRVHGDWNAHGTLGWRLSSSSPNLQNYPNMLRDILDAAPGWCLVGCDQAQLELRMVAAMAGAKSYLESFAAKADPHLQLCLATFGPVFEKANKDAKKSFRRFVKEGTYASLYRALIETVHSVLASAEDLETERLVFPNIPMSQVAAFHRVFIERNPEIPIWWEALDKEYADRGFLTEDVLGLRCDFLDGERDPQLGNKLANFKAQSGGAALVHIATKRFVENMPKAWIGKVKLVNQGHDALTPEVLADHPGPQVKTATERRWCADPNCECLPSRVNRFLEECFTIDGREFGLDVPFLGEGAIGNTWKET